jgi:hypothetical protein
MRSLHTSQMLLSLDFWLLFVQFTVASGVCLAYLNNLVRGMLLWQTAACSVLLRCCAQQASSLFLSSGLLLAVWISQVLLVTACHIPDNVA